VARNREEESSTARQMISRRSEGYGGGQVPLRCNALVLLEFECGAGHEVKLIKGNGEQQARTGNVMSAEKRGVNDRSAVPERVVQRA